MRRERRFKAEINVVPYIDVMLVLLIIFMVSAPMLSPGQIDLPTMGAQLSPTVAPFEVRIARDGSLTAIDRQASARELKLTRDALVPTVIAAQTAAKNRSVVIAADKDVRYEEVLKVMDALSQAGVERVGLLAKPRAGQ